MTKRLLELLSRPGVVIVYVGVFLIGGLLFDLRTQDVVVAIIFNVPIAISGLANSRRLTAWVIVLALAANFVAAYENAVTFDGFDTVAAANRVLVAMSILIVGWVSLARETAVDEAGHLTGAIADRERERLLRSFLTDLWQDVPPEVLIGNATVELKKLLQAESVLVVSLEAGRFGAARWLEGPDHELAAHGSLASWAVDAIPTNSRPAITIRSEDGLLTVGRWRREHANDLIVVAEQPAAEKSAYLLGEALSGLSPLLDLLSQVAHDTPLGER